MALPADVRAALRRRDADLTRLGDRIGAELVGLRDTLRDRLIELAEASGGGDWRTGLLAVQLDQVAAAVAEETGEIQDQWLDGLDDIERATPAYLRSVGLDPDNVIDVEALAAVIDAARRDAIDAFRTANLTTATDLVPLMREGYRLGIDERHLAEAICLTIQPAGLPNVVRAAALWRRLIAAAEVPASDAFRAWAALPAEGDA